MRALCLSLLVVAAGCASDTLDNTAYRRVVDGFDSADQCAAEGDFARCYDTLTFCSDGSVNATLEFRQEGHYEFHESEAIAQLPYKTVVFDLEKATSPQLPGRHPWELVEPVYYDCAP